MKATFVSFVLFAWATTAGCKESSQTGPSAASAAANLTVTSEAFSANGEIPTEYTCEGSDTAPPLAWSGAPAGTKSFALVMDDPDAPDPAAPKMTWVHWVAFAIPAETKSLPKGGALPAGAKSGINDFKKTGYGGPCPPTGRHRYFHKIYALDATLADLQNPTKADLEKAMNGHILAKGELIGTYQKKK